MPGHDGVAHPVIKRPKGAQPLPFWIADAWVLGHDPDGRNYRSTIIARSRAERREGLVVKIYDDELAGKTEKEANAYVGQKLARALINLGFGWFVLKHKLSAKE